MLVHDRRHRSGTAAARRQFRHGTRLACACCHHPSSGVRLMDIPREIFEDRLQAADRAKVLDRSRQFP